MLDAEQVATMSAMMKNWSQSIHDTLLYVTKMATESANCPVCCLTSWFRGYPAPSDSFHKNAVGMKYATIALILAIAVRSDTAFSLVRARL